MDWMPPNMRKEIERIEGEATGENAEIPKRLRTNPALRKVVKELTEIRHASALGEVLRAAYVAARDGGISATKGEEAAAMKTTMLNDIAAMRRVADALVESNPRDSRAKKHAGIVYLVSCWYEAGAETLRGPGDPFVVKHNYGDPIERGVLIAIVSFFEHRFGQPLYRTAATLTAIVLGLEKVSIHAARRAAARCATSKPKAA